MMSPRSSSLSGDDRLREAVRVAVAREDRSESPRGEWRDRLWYPAAEERRICCERITPTEANRQALESHCRTQAHIANLYDISSSELRRSVKRARPATGTTAGASEPLLRDLASSGRRAEALCEASRAVRSETRETLRAESKRVLEILSHLLAALEIEADFGEILDQASLSVDRLRLILDYCRTVEATVVGARAVQEWTVKLLENKRSRVA